MGSLDGNRKANIVANEIIDLILKSDMKPGDKLPSERELAQRFGVGRPSVREAVSALVISGIIDIHQGDGLFVSDLDVDKLMMPFRLCMDLGKFNYEQLMEIRELFEPAAAEMAARLITDEQIEEVEAIVRNSNLENPYSFAEDDRKLHTTIFKATGNYLFLLIMQIVDNLASLSREVTGRYLEVRKVVHQDHIRIVQALQKRDEKAAGEYMKQHIEHIRMIMDLNEDVFKSEFLKVIQNMDNVDLKVDP